MRSAVELQEAGIKFKGKKDCNFLHVSFRDGVLEIPTLRIFERTIPMLRNLIAFEQCYPETSKHVTYFADLMDSLIDTLRDVNVLQDAGILKIGLNNQEEVAHLFNRLCKHVFYNNSRSYLGNVYRDVNRFCDSKCHRWRALLVREKFSNPWAIISLVVAFIFLVLDLLQTFYSVLGYYHPPSP
ncbi:hypothetical protein QJS04_geneDACA010173 [Acorus gramineus]|uniref:Uncharacterized protein n=1 Tax=Acorus gramineus TaxID=55184 RepID=A0AAV9A5J9_ACOGR|nr:hypothetical protein QJS04_geneDACA010173 [Acorus gramineus]